MTRQNKPGTAAGFPVAPFERFPPAACALVLKGSNFTVVGGEFTPRSATGRNHDPSLKNRAVTMKKNPTTLRTLLVGLASMSLALGAFTAAAHPAGAHQNIRAIGAAAHVVRDHRHQRGTHWHSQHRAVKKFHSKRASDPHGRSASRIKLDLPIRFRGTDTLRLRRIAQSHYGIDLNRYRLVRVVVDGQGRRHRPATARLIVGDHRSPSAYVDGRTAFRAPQAKRKASWQLGVHNAKIDRVQLVLEPRFHETASRWDFGNSRSTRKPGGYSAY